MSVSVMWVRVGVCVALTGAWGCGGGVHGQVGDPVASPGFTFGDASIEVNDAGVPLFGDAGNDGFVPGDDGGLVVDFDRDGVGADLDCDDNNAAVRPGAVEICGNEVDEDCSGVADVCAACVNGPVALGGCNCDGEFRTTGFCCDGSYQDADCAGTSATLQVQGRYLLDTCGNRFVPRGLEQPLGYGFEVGPGQASLENLLDRMAESGANAVRLLLDMHAGQPSMERYGELVDYAASLGLVVYLSAYTDDPSPYESFWARADVMDIVMRNKKWVIVDAIQEVAVNDYTAWRDLSVGMIAYMRDLGYDVPMTVICPNNGRDLRGALAYGGEIAASDPLGRIILGWQAYWGSGGWYQSDYGGEYGLASPTSLADGIEVAARQSFPIQAGLDYVTDINETADYQSAMAAAAATDTGWLWWAYYHPFEPADWRNGLTADGTLDNLYEPYGAQVLYDHPDAIDAAVPACGR